MPLPENADRFSCPEAASKGGFPSLRTTGPVIANKVKQSHAPDAQTGGTFPRAGKKAVPLLYRQTGQGTRSGGRNGIFLNSIVHIVKGRLKTPFRTVNFAAPGLKNTSRPCFRI
jgi:hypothetical protein